MIDWTVVSSVCVGIGLYEAIKALLELMLNLFGIKGE